MKSIVLIFLLVGGCGVTVGLTREYIFNTTSLTWSKAQSFCRTSYKDLATITTMEENMRLLQSGSEIYGSWIGLRNTSGNWTWSDREQAVFLNWYNGSPIGLNECAYIPSINYPYQRLWITVTCTKTASFYCYRFLILVKENKTWEEADQYCRTRYTGLASVTSQTSLNQLKVEKVEAQTVSAWTGLHFVNGTWLWVSKEKLGSLVSMPSCPAPAYRCGAFDNTTNTLENLNCNKRLNFICYWM